MTQPSRKQRSEALHLGVILRQHRGETIREEETVRAGVRRLRVVPPIEEMWNRDHITARQYDAAVKLMGDYELGVLGGREADELPPGVDKSGSAELMNDRQLRAHTAYKRAMRAMGLRLSWVVVEVVLCSRRLSAVADERRVDRNKLTAILDVALDVLADHYGY